MKKIFYGKQSIDSRDIKSVVNVMNSDFLTQGPISPKFEKVYQNIVIQNFVLLLIQLHQHYI